MTSWKGNPAFLRTFSISFLSLSLFLSLSVSVSVSLPIDPIGTPRTDPESKQHFCLATPAAEQCTAICHAFQSVLDVPLIGIQMDINISRARPVPARCGSIEGSNTSRCKPRPLLVNYARLVDPAECFPNFRRHFIYERAHARRGSISFCWFRDIPWIFRRTFRRQ